MPPAVASPRTQAKRPGDLTGVRGQQMATVRDKTKAEQKSQIAEALEADRVQKSQEEVDYSADARKQAREAAAAGVVEEGNFEVRPKTRRIRVNWPIDDMVFGREVIREAEYDEHGVMSVPPVLGGLRNMSFEPGRWYTVDADVADHLTFLGYIYGE